MVEVVSGGGCTYTGYCCGVNSNRKGWGSVSERFATKWISDLRAVWMVDIDVVRCGYGERET